MTNEAQLVYPVLAELQYAHSHVDGSGDSGKTSTIVGIATSLENAHRMISADHLETLLNEGLNPVKNPLLVVDVERGGIPIKGSALTITGSDESGTWVNTITWTIAVAALDELLENFEL